MATITKSLTIESQGTYNLTFDLWSYSEWAASAGITTSYASLAALIADEKAVRQLMTVHASVDYFANCPDSTIISTVINNDLCAKWINLRDYALDTLSAKSNIKSVMDTADKYGYGEWGKIDSTTWGPLGNVPIMTANNAPYGVASGENIASDHPAYYAFDGNSATYLSSTPNSNIVVKYQFPAPVNVRKVKIVVSEMYLNTFSLEGSNDGSTWTPLYSGQNDTSITTTHTIDFNISNNNYYLYYKLNCTQNRSYVGLVALQFYGRELKPLVPTMTDDTQPKGVASTNSTYEPAYKAFGSAQTFAFDGSNQYLRYQGTDKTVLKYVATKDRVNSRYSFTATYAIQGSNDGTTWDDIKTNIAHVFPTTSAWWGIECGDNDDQYLYHQLVFASYTGPISGQMTHAVQFYGMDYSEKEFAQGSTRKTIYDHGVAPSGAITGGTKNPDCLTLSAVGTATVTVDKGTRTYMGGKAGLHASGTNRLKCGSGYSNFTASNMPDSNGFDISSISGSIAVGIEQTASGTFDVKELWLE